MGKAETAPKAEESIIWSQDPQRKQRPLKPKGIHETMEHLPAVKLPRSMAHVLERGPLRAESGGGGYYFL